MDRSHSSGGVTSTGPLPGSPLVQAAAQLRQVLLPYRKARRHGVAAEAEEKILTGGNAGVQVEALHTAAAALALAVLINGHHDDGAASLFHQPGCHDANDTRGASPGPRSG